MESQKTDRGIQHGYLFYLTGYFCVLNDILDMKIKKEK